ncbi:MAG: DUF3021 domain-containing protein [Eubacterium sp.]|nr:DUF3021 domain-containing protein [Eubacterium sp.]
MKNFKVVMKRAFISIAMSFIIFIVIGIIFDMKDGGNFTLTDYGFTKMALACVVTGLGFGVPTILYNSERISQTLASVIHLGIGFTIYFAAASFVGWIPVERGIKACVITVVSVVIIGLIIWVCFMKYNKDLAEKMNKALKNDK